MPSQADMAYALQCIQMFASFCLQQKMTRKLKQKYSKHQLAFCKEFCHEFSDTCRSSKHQNHGSNFDDEDTNIYGRNFSTINRNDCRANRCTTLRAPCKKIKHMPLKLMEGINTLLGRNNFLFIPHDTAR